MYQQFNQTNHRFTAEVANFQEAALSAYLQLSEDSLKLPSIIFILGHLTHISQRTEICNSI